MNENDLPLFMNNPHKDPYAEIRKIADEIKHHDTLYHGKDAPEISDADYDLLRARYNKLKLQFPDFEPTYDPEKKLGAPALPGFKKIAHRLPMLSLNNAFSQEDIDDFISRIRRFLQLNDYAPLSFMAEPKVDGLSCSLRYENGLLIEAATRGDGNIGENITENIRTIACIPHKLNAPYPDILEIRGEIFMNRQDFIRLNKEREEIKEQPFANPRNAAAGSVRQLDPAITAQRHLNFFAYALGETSAPQETSQKNLRLSLKNWGFKLNEPAQLCHTTEDLISFYKKLEKDRHILEYDIDGVVYKIDSTELQQRLGFASRAPRWAIAHKFQAEQAETVIQDIIIQVGRTGVLTPVAVLQPITVGGVVVSRATLHNEDEIERKDIHIHDTVKIQRAGDVIPQVIEVILSKRPTTSHPYIFPNTCPECHSNAVREEGMSARRCTGGLICPAQTLERLRHFISRNAFNIEGFGEKRVAELWKDGLLTTPASIFRLKQHKEALSQREGWGEKSTSNLLEAIESHRTISLDKFIYALGIRQVGEATAKLLARHYKTLFHFRTSICEARDSSSDAWIDLTNLDQIGPLVARDICIFFSEPHNLEAIDDLISEIQVSDILEDLENNKPLSGKTIVFTGTLERMGRTEAKTKAESLGATVAGSVSSKTTFVVVGSDAGSKAIKAHSLGVRCLDENEWIKCVLSNDFSEYV